MIHETSTGSPPKGFAGAPTVPSMISVRGLTKTYGAVTAVDDVSFDVEPGKVTGFLGPNGAGKSTTMRAVMGLDRPTSGTATINGQSYSKLDNPLRHVGALLDAAAMHPGRSGRAHLRVAAYSNGIPLSRVDDVIEQVGLSSVARRRIKGYSLGMRQRLGIAAALLGDPQVLLFDEPVNGLDLDGVRWIRTLFREFADEGRTVLVSSHLMSEVQMVADQVIIIGRGRLIADSPTQDLLNGLGGKGVRVRVGTTHGDDLRRALAKLATVEDTGQEEFEVIGLPPFEIGDLALRLGVPIHHLAVVEQSLEHAYLALTEDSVEYQGATA